MFSPVEASNKVQSVLFTSLKSISGFGLITHNESGHCRVVVSEIGEGLINIFPFTKIFFPATDSIEICDGVWVRMMDGKRLSEGSFAGRDSKLPLVPRVQLYHCTMAFFLLEVNIGPLGA